MPQTVNLHPAILRLKDGLRIQAATVELFPQEARNLIATVEDLQGEVERLRAVAEAMAGAGETLIDKLEDEPGVHGRPERVGRQAKTCPTCQAIGALDRGIASYRATTSAQRLKGERG